MNDFRHTVLLVDNEENVINSLRRLLRKESYSLLTANSGPHALKTLQENKVHLIISDQRMLRMSGTQLLAIVKDKYPDIIRIILTGHTDVDSITESINKGHIYKLFLKPWNDESLKLEIKQALKHYDTIQDNKILQQKVLSQYEELKRMNQALETLVQKRTHDLEIQNQALELSRAILEDLAVPVIGVGTEGIIVLTNKKARKIRITGSPINIGKRLNDCLPADIREKILFAIKSGTDYEIKDLKLSGIRYNINLTPLTKPSKGRGVILALIPK